MLVLIDIETDGYRQKYFIENTINIYSLDADHRERINNWMDNLLNLASLNYKW